MKFYFIYFSLDIPSAVRMTLIRGGLFIAAFTSIEFMASLFFGATDGSAGRDAINFLTGT